MATPHAQVDVIVDGMRLRLVDEGPRNGETVVVLTGHTARIEDYDALVPRLAGSYRVLLPDLPGKGYSAKPDRRYSFALYHEVVLGLLDALGIERAHLAGGSLGANLALRIAHARPERIGRIVAWGPGGAWSARPWLAALIRAVGRPALFWPAIRIHSRLWYSGDFADRERLLRDKFAYYEEVMGPGFVRMYVDMAAESVGTSLFDIAPEIRSPVLLVRGDRDEAAGLVRGVARLRELLPHAELLTLPNARHALAQEAPDELARSIGQFLSRPASALP